MNKENPYKIFDIWYKIVINSNSTDANAMVLATADASGKPSARMVLLKSHDRNGFVFYTNALSRKGSELQENPYAALLFYWERSYQQIRIEGSIERLSAEESDAYFYSRPLENQISAYLSRQSQVLTDPDAFNRDFFQMLVTGTKPTRPPDWGGYRLRPTRFEFWSGKQNRMHTRTQYDWIGDEWLESTLYP